MERVAVDVSKQQIKGIKSDISFKAYAKEITVILSPDSAFIHSLFHKLLLPKNTGISYYDHKICKQREYILNFLGYMSADLPAFKRMTIEEYFKYSSKFYQGNYKGNIDKLISFFNLHQNQAIKSLTYEEKKILSFIDSIFFEPEVLILEDPFSNVSNITSAKMIKAINQLKDNGFSIILSSIRYDELDIADRIYLLNEDGINEYKKPKHDKLVISFNFDEKQESIEEFLKNVEAYDIIQSNNKVSFCYDKNINDLLFKLAKIKIFDLKFIPQSIYHLEV